MPNWFNQVKNFLQRAWQGLRMLPRVRSRHLPQILESITKKDFAVFTATAAAFLLAGGFLVHAYFFSGESNIPDYGGEHVEGLVGQPRFINPVLAPSSPVDLDLTKLIYGQLLKFDKNMNLAPDLAQGLPAISADQKTYTIQLRPGLKWQDGKPITSDDITYTIQTIQNPNFDSPLISNWNRVKVEKVDDLTVRVTLHEVSASFITNFTLAILPQHIWSNLSASNFRLSDLNLSPIGSGPYMIREIRKTPDGTIKSITLKANNQYYSSSPFITYFTFKFYPDTDALIQAYQSKDIQSLGFLPFDKKMFLENSDRQNQYRISLPQYQAVFFNLPKNPILSQKAVRQALWLATDRQPIINDVFLGLAEPDYGPIIKGNLGYDPSLEQATHFNLDEAGSILDKAGWQLDPASNQRYRMLKQGKNQVRQNLEFNLATNAMPLNVKTAQIIQGQWAKVGATVHLVVVSAQDLDNQYIRPRNFDALVFSENTGADPDPFPFWHSSQAHDPGLNLSGFSNPTVDKLLTEARRTNDTNVRSKDYQQFQAIITQEIPAIFLDSAIYLYSLPKKEHGFDLDTIIYPQERFLDVSHWYIDTKRR